MRNTINILVVTPDGLMTELLKAALSACSHFRVVDHISGEEGISGVAERELVDIALVSPAESSRRDMKFLFRRLRVELPAVRLIALLDSRDKNRVVDAFREGARGVLSLNHVAFEILCQCVDLVDSGQIWASNEEIGWVIDAFEAKAMQEGTLNIVDAAGLKLLTGREEEVVLLVMDGLSNREIARTLTLSEHTVKNYLFHVFDKLGVSSRTELVAYAVNAMKKPAPRPARQSAGQNRIVRSYASPMMARLGRSSDRLHDITRGERYAPSFGNEDTGNLRHMLRPDSLHRATACAAAEHERSCLLSHQPESGLIETA